MDVLMFHKRNVTASFILGLIKNTFRLFGVAILISWSTAGQTTALIDPIVVWRPFALSLIVPSASAACVASTVLTGGYLCSRSVCGANPQYYSYPYPGFANAWCSDQYVNYLGGDTQVTTKALCQAGWSLLTNNLGPDPSGGLMGGYYKCSPPVIIPTKNPGPTLCNGTNPINGGTGDKFQVENDYVGTGTFPLKLIRS